MKTLCQGGLLSWIKESTRIFQDWCAGRRGLSARTGVLGGEVYLPECQDWCVGRSLSARTGVLRGEIYLLGLVRWEMSNYQDWCAGRRGLFGRTDLLGGEVYLSELVCWAERSICQD